MKNTKKINLEYVLDKYMSLIFILTVVLLGIFSMFVGLLQYLNIEAMVGHFWTVVLYVLVGVILSSFYVKIIKRIIREEKTADISIVE